MAWLSLIVAGLLEMVGVVMIGKFHKKRDFTSLVQMILGFTGSFLCLSYAMKTLQMGTAYAIWTGIGASGGAILGMILFNEPRQFKRIVFIALILIGAIGLKLVS